MSVSLKAVDTQGREASANVKLEARAQTQSLDAPNGQGRLQGRRHAPPRNHLDARARGRLPRCSQRRADDSDARRRDGRRARSPRRRPDARDVRGGRGACIPVHVGRRPHLRPQARLHRPGGRPPRRGVGGARELQAGRRRAHRLSCDGRRGTPSPPPSASRLWTRRSSPSRTSSPVSRRSS
jgi:hypothetical protein